METITGTAAGVPYAFCTRRPGDHREHHDPEAVDESGSQQGPARYCRLTPEAALASVAGPLQLDDGDDPVGLALVLTELGLHGDLFGVDLVALGTGQHTSGDRERFYAVLDGGVRVGHQVVVPGRVLRAANTTARCRRR